MANTYKVGGLSLEIQAQDKDTVASLSAMADGLNHLGDALKKIPSKSINDVRKLVASFSSLNGAIGKLMNLDTTAFSEKIVDLTEGLSPLINRLSSVKEELAGLGDIARYVSKTGNARTREDNIVDPPPAPIDSIKSQIDKTAEQTDEIPRAKEGKEVYDELTESIQKYNAEQAKAELKQHKAAVAAEKQKVEYYRLQLASDEGKKHQAEYTAELEKAEAELDRLLAKTRKTVNETTEGFEKQIQKTQEYSDAEANLVLKEYEAELAAAKRKMQYYQLAAATAKSKTEQAQYTAELKEATKEYERLYSITRKTSKQASGMQWLLSVVKRISVWRIIRQGIQWIATSISTGINNLVQFSDSANDTMSAFTSAVTVIQTSIGAIVLPLLELITPVIQQIAVAFADLANTVSQAMSTTGTYTKINTDYLQDYLTTLNKASTFSFDKFETLSNSNNLSGLFSTETVDEENTAVSALSAALTSLKNIINNLISIFTKLWDIVSPIADVLLVIVEYVVEAIDGLLGIASAATKWLDTMGALEPFVYTIFAMLAIAKLNSIKKSILGIVASFGSWKSMLSSMNTVIYALVAGFSLLALGVGTCISNWDNLSTYNKTLVVGLSALAAIMVGVFTAAALIMNMGLSPLAGIAYGVAAAAAVGGIVASVSSSLLADNAYAEGGLPDEGTVFLAGEAGPEVVYDTGGGQSGVMNVEQMGEAFELALQNSGTVASLKTIAAKDTSVNIDGKYIARSKNFKREASRIHLGKTIY